MRETNPKKKGCHSGNCDSRVYSSRQALYIPIIAESFVNVKHGIKIQEV